MRAFLILLKRVISFSPICQKWTPRGQYRCQRWWCHKGLHYAVITSPQHDYRAIEWDDNGNIDAW